MIGRDTRLLTYLLVAPAASVSAHDIENPFAAVVNPVPVGGLGVAGSAWGELFEAPPGLIAVTSVTQTPANPACASPLNTQFSVARGFAGANGFVISNGYVEDFDDDGMVAGDPTGCADILGSMGFTGIDIALALALQAGYGPSVPPPGYPTMNAGVFTVNFTAFQAVEVDISYTFATYESPADPFFFDSFGVFLDGVLLAGGASRDASVGPFGGPVPGTDPWTLSPSGGFPAPEFNRPPLPAFFVFPAHTTGVRTVSMSVAAGLHVLEFHVADGGPALGGSPPGSDTIVNSALFFGVSTYHSGVPTGTGVCGSSTITRVGHPSATVGPHGPSGTGFQDFQVRGAGAVPGSSAIVALGTSGGSLPVAGTCDLFVDPFGAFVGIFAGGVVSAGGQLDWPAPAIAIPPGLVGANLFAQLWYVLPGGGMENSKGIRFRIGPS